jgi:histone-arginine methyltransferase CARM1
MEIQKQSKQQQEFALASMTELASSSSSSSFCSDSQSVPVTARFSADNGVVELRFNRESESADSISVDVKTARVSDYYFLFFNLIFFCLVTEKACEMVM